MAQPLDAGESAPGGTEIADNVNEKWVVNLSGKSLSDAELRVLRK